MIATAHGIVGGAIAITTVNNPLLGLTISTISHPLLDMVPHWDFGRDWQKQSKLRLTLVSLSDLGLGYLLPFLLFYNSSTPLWYFLVCITLSSGWDPATGPYMIFNWKFPPFSWLYNFQNKIQNDADFKTGVLVQIAFLGLVIAAVRYLGK